MLDRVAVHQTRLRTPGLGLDAKGVALGAKGLVLLPSIDRLVAFLALYTRQGSLTDILRSLTVEVVRSKLGAREVTLTFAADGSDRLDRIAEVARLAGGYTFTGTSRHFVQYRDAAAPFGYDIGQITPSDAALSLYHNAFSQVYDVERQIEVRALLLRLEPHLDPSTHREPGARWIAAEAGLGPALIHYFVRSGVDAEVGVAEWPPASSFDDAPVVRYLFRVPEVPARMTPLLSRTPGLGVFVPVAPGAAVEVGYRHPVNLRACPVFAEAGLVLFRGGGRDVLELDRLPALGDVGAFARVDLRKEVASARAPGAAPAPRPSPSSSASCPAASRGAPSPRAGSAPTRCRSSGTSRTRSAPSRCARRASRSPARARSSAIERHRGHPRRRVLPRGPPRSLHPGRRTTRSPPSRPTSSTARSDRRPGRSSSSAATAAPSASPATRSSRLETRFLEAQAWAPLTAHLRGPHRRARHRAAPRSFLGGVGIRPLRDVPPSPSWSRGRARPRRSPRRAPRGGD